MDDVEQPVIPAGDTPAADPAAPAPPAGEAPKEPDPVPYSRFKEVNDAKTALETEREREREEHEAELAEARKAKESPKPDEDEWGDDDTPVTKKELKELQQKQAKQAEEQQAVSAIQNRHKELEKEYDGKDGRPPYKQKDIDAFARKNGFYPPDPLDVYHKMNFDKLTDWKAEQKIKASKPDHIEKNKAPKEPAKTDTSKMSTEEYDAHIRSKRSS